jgi:short-subunit dehydrogenase
VDFLINNAGISNMKFFHDQDFREFENVFKVNFLGSANLIKCILPSMINNNSGHIINISSATDLI